MLQTTLLELAELDRIVHGGGGQWLLRGVPQVLRMRVIAPFDIRVKHLGEARRGDGGEASHPDGHRDRAA